MIHIFGGTQYKYYMDHNELEEALVYNSRTEFYVREVIGDYKGFSNRDVTILSMNKTQKYLRY